MTWLLGPNSKITLLICSVHKLMFVLINSEQVDTNRQQNSVRLKIVLDDHWNTSPGSMQMVITMPMLPGVRFKSNR